jgi:hypothetical protein
MPVNTNIAIAGSTKVGNIWHTSHALADEGSYFTASNPTVGTAIAMTTSVVDDAATASSTHAQAAPYLYMYNRGVTGDQNAKSVYLKYIKLFSRIGDQAWTSATQALFSVRSDPNSRYTSGGTALTTTNVNTNVGTASQVIAYAGANVVSLPNATTGRVLAHGLIQSSIPLAGSTWIWTFGDVTQPTNFGYASVINSLTIPCPPAVIAPGWSLQLDIWATALAAAPTFEIEVGYVERFAGL